MGNDCTVIKVESNDRDLAILTLDVDTGVSVERFKVVFK